MTHDRTIRRMYIRPVVARRGLLAVAMAVAVVGSSSPARAAEPATAIVLEDAAGPQLQSADALRLMKDELAQLTRLELKLRQRLGEAHPETEAAARTRATAARRLDAEIDRLAAVTEAALPQPVAAPSLATPTAWGWPHLAWPAFLLAALSLAIAACWALVRAPRRATAHPDTLEKRMQAPLVLPLPAVADRPALLHLARSPMTEPGGMLAAAVGRLQARIDGDGPRRSERVVVVTSVDTEAGALVASSLAHALLLTGARTLLVDADAADARLTRILCGEPDKRGGTASGADLMLLDQVTGLWLLPARAAGEPIAASEVERMRQVFDAVVLSLPLPVSAHDRTSGAALLGLADQVVAASASGRPSENLTRLALRKLDVAAEVLHVRIDRGASLPAGLAATGGLPRAA